MSIVRKWTVVALRLAISLGLLTFLVMWNDAWAMSEIGQEHPVDWVLLVLTTIVANRATMGGKLWF